MANVTKLIRLAATFEARSGRDARGFIDRARAELEAEAREPDAPIELEGLDAVRLMTIHAAKGLEFGVVVLADLGRQIPGGGDGIRLGPEGAIGLKLRRLGAPSQDAFSYAELGELEKAADRKEDERVFYVACTRARERLILSGSVKLDKWPNGTAPIGWLAPRFAPGAASGAGTELVSVTHSRARRPGQRSCARPFPRRARGMMRPSRAPRPARRDLAELPAPPPPPAVRSLSYSAFSGYAACQYRFYLERVLRLPRVAEPVPDAPADPEALDRMVRGSIAHLLLEQLDLERPAVPDTEAVGLAARMSDAEVTAEDVADLQELVRAAIEGDVLARALAARRVRREEGFAFILDDVPFTGYIDLLAEEEDGTVLVVDYKTNPVQGVDLEALTEADYGAQRRIYALAALRSGAPAVEVVHLYLERPSEPVIARYEAARHGGAGGPAPRRRRTTHARRVPGRRESAPRPLQWLPGARAAVHASARADGPGSLAVLVGQQRVAVEHRAREVDHGAARRARLRAQQLECRPLVHRMALHQDPLGALDERTTLQRGLELIDGLRQFGLLRVTADGNLQRALHRIARDRPRIGVDAAVGRLADELGVLVVEQGDDWSRRERHDLVDQAQRVLVVAMHDDDRRVGILARDGVCDLGGAHGELGDLMAEVAQDGRRVAQRRLVFVGGEDSQASDLRRCLLFPQGAIPHTAVDGDAVATLTGRAAEHHRRAHLTPEQPGVPIRKAVRCRNYMPTRGYPTALLSSHGSQSGDRRFPMSDFLPARPTARGRTSSCSRATSRRAIPRRAMRWSNASCRSRASSPAATSAPRSRSTT